MTARFGMVRKSRISSGMGYILHGVLSMVLVAGLAGQPRVAHAKQIATPASGDDIYVPTSAWLVGPASLAPADGAQAPCVMANQFNDGLLVRFSGGGQKLYAMAVDFRQKVFTPGQAYPVDLKVGAGFDKTVRAEAYDAATLLINLQAQPGLYKQVADSRTMRLGLGKRTFEFAMLGANEGLKRMETCFSPGESDDMPNSGLRTGMQTNTVPSRVPPIARDVEARDVEAVDPSYKQALGNTALGAADSDAAQPDPAASLGMHTLSAPAAAPVAAVAKADLKGGASQAEGGAGDDAGPNGPGGLVGRMLKKAAGGIGGLSGTSGEMGLQTALTPQPPKVARIGGKAGLSQQIQGSTEPEAHYQAVADSAASVAPAAPAEAGAAGEAGASVPEATSGGALAKSWTSTRIFSNTSRDLIEGAQRSIGLDQSKAQPSAAPASQPAPQSVGQSVAQSAPQIAPSSGEAEKRWRAMSGANLRDILTIWAQDEHVKLVWNAGKDYPVQQSLSEAGDFDGAVRNILQQYNNGTARPVGQLYRDASGQKVLVINQDQPAL